MKKKFITGVCTMAMVGMSCFGTNVFAGEIEDTVPSEIIATVEEQPVAEENSGSEGDRGFFFTAISSYSRSIELLKGGQVYCTADTVVRRGYTAKVTVELQQGGGVWSTIKTWTDKADDFACVEEKYYVPKGHDYRVKVTHQAYDGSTRLDNYIDYTDTVSY